MRPLNPATARLGTENAFTVLARAGQIAASGADVINLGIGQPDFRTPEHIVEAGIKALRDGAHGYTPSAGLPQLREAVAADLGARYGHTPKATNVHIVPGGKPIIFMAAMLLGGPENEIMLPDPGFPIYHSAISYSGARPVPYGLVEENGFAFDADDVLSKITPRTSLIIINSPANPTGGATPKAEMDKFIKGMAEFPHVTILSDEIYDRFVFDAPPLSLLSYPEIADRLIILNGWSKTYAMTGWRIGYGIWPDRLMDVADRLGVNYHSCVNAPTQFAALAATTGPQDAVDEMCAAFARRAELITTSLNQIDGISCVAPRGAFYAFANISQLGQNSEFIQNKLLEEYHLATIAGTSFGAFGEGYLRLSSANSEAAIEAACARLSQMVSDL